MGWLKISKEPSRYKANQDRGQPSKSSCPRLQRPDTKKEDATTSVLPTGTDRILFVDDEELLVKMARGMVESLGYHVTVAANGTDAWKLFRKSPSRFDLVITDQTMPDLTGVRLAEWTLKVRKDIPIILCTGYSETVSRREGARSRHPCVCYETRDEEGTGRDGA